MDGSDLGSVLCLLSQLHPTEPKLVRKSVSIQNAWLRIQEQDDRAIFVAQADGDIVGTIDCYITPNLTHDGRPYATVENFIVTEKFRRRGVGKALMSAVVDHAREAGCYKIQLQSSRGRDAAHQFYEAQGFVQSSDGYRLYFHYEMAKQQPRR